MRNLITWKATHLVVATIAIVIGTAISAAPAAAGVISYQLTGDTNNLFVGSGNNGEPYTTEDIFLTDESTGLSQLPGFSLNVGDTISGTLRLSSPFTMPASAGLGSFYPGEILLALEGTGSASNIYFPESLTYYDNGVQVSPPSGLNPFGGSGGRLTFGEDSVVAIPSFTFDELVFSGTVSEILDNNFQSVSSADLTAASPFLETITYSAGAPEPATAWYALSALGLGALALQKKRAGC